jgi:hypothetical protein
MDTQITRGVVALELTADATHTPIHIIITLRTIIYITTHTTTMDITTTMAGIITTTTTTAVEYVEGG